MVNSPNYSICGDIPHFSSLLGSPGDSWIQSSQPQFSLSTPKVFIPPLSSKLITQKKSTVIYFCLSSKSSLSKYFYFFLKYNSHYKNVHPSIEYNSMAFIYSQVSANHHHSSGTFSTLQKETCTLYLLPLPSLTTLLL